MSNDNNLEKILGLLKKEAKEQPSPLSIENIPAMENVGSSKPVKSELSIENIPKPNEEKKTEEKILSTDERPQWPIRGGWSSLGEFGQGDARHREGKSEQELAATGGHAGLDMEANAGTPIYPMLSGTVQKAYTPTAKWKKKGDPEKQGNIVVIDHGNGLITRYMHLQEVTTSPGAKVTQQTQIGSVGNSGNAVNTNPHLHFEVLEKGSPKNPRTAILEKPEPKLKSKLDRKARMVLFQRLVKQAVAADKVWEDED